MKNLPFNKVLALSPHTDDMEFGCSATLHRLLQNGANVHSAVFSLCEDSVPEGLAKDVLLHEMQAAARVLGIPEKNVHVFNYPVRRFSEQRQDILEDLVRLRREITPDLVFTPASTDVHQDHQVIHRESIRAFRYQSMLGYELPWNTMSFHAQAVIEISEENLNQKAKALACYKSQAFRHYFKTELFRSQASVRGLQNKTSFSEAFEVIRLAL